MLKLQCKYMWLGLDAQHTAVITYKEVAVARRANIFANDYY